MGNQAVKGKKAIQCITCTCCQWAGCCCCNWCLETACAADYVLCSYHLPCILCCSIAPSKMVFLAGRNGAGKTTLLYQLLTGSVRNAEKTFGANTEIINFNRFQKYEFWDPAGSLAQRDLWPVYYNNMQFDYVVYVIDGYQYIRAEPSKRTRVFHEDRMELHALMHEEALQDAKFVVWINFPQDVTPKMSQEVLAVAEDDLEVEDKVPVVAGLRPLKQSMDIHPKKYYPGFLCPS